MPAADDVDALLDELDGLLDDSPPRSASKPPPRQSAPAPAALQHQQTGAAPSSSLVGSRGQPKKGNDDLDSLLDEVEGITSPPRRSAPAPPSAKSVAAFSPFSSSSAGASDEHATNFRCSKCDLRVLRFVEQQWMADADYMFFRNFMPNVSKLQAKLTPADGKCAFSCQCTWVTQDLGVPHGVNHWFVAR